MQRFVRLRDTPGLVQERETPDKTGCLDRHICMSCKQVHFNCWSKLSAWPFGVRLKGHANTGTLLHFAARETPLF